MDSPDSSIAGPAVPSASQLTVVGIGASAGGIEAISELLRKLDSETGLAFVVVLHLDPKLGSQLAEVLSRCTSLKVHEAIDNQTLEANRVYVIPPGTTLRVKDGALRLAPREATQHAALPIDTFFCSLADDFGSRSIGVILSGTGTDSTYGLKSIKAAAGITFAQNNTAQHPGMPQSAIQNSCVDFILSPGEIAGELNKFSQHPFLHQDETSLEGLGDESPTQKERAYAAIFRILRHATNVDFANYKRTTIERRIRRRLVVHRLDRVTDYLALLQSQPEEIVALQQDLLIHVTRFFRDPSTFDSLKKVIFPNLHSGQEPQGTIRVWVPGCATGEEVYSLAICLVEYLADHVASTSIKIFATDISENALVTARAGNYPSSIAADVSPERLTRFFHATENGYQIVKAIRDLCVFSRHDATGDPPFSNLDLISCRNVLIYLGPLLQKRVLALFHYALKPNHFLMLGSSETVGSLSDLFETKDSQNRIYTTKPVKAQINFDFGAGSTKFLDTSPSLKSKLNILKRPDLNTEVNRLVASHFAPAGVVVDDNLEIVQFRGETGAFLAPAPGYASLSVLKMAREGLSLEIRAAIDEVRQSGKPVLRKHVRSPKGGQVQHIHLHVLPLAIGNTPNFVILFEQVRPEEPVESSPSSTGNVQLPQSQDQVVQYDLQRELDRLENELTSTKLFLQSTIEEMDSSNEELKAANEEILSSNEELQSTNEELQTAKEELQASNEELSTVNEELNSRNTEALRLGDDLENLLRSVDIPIVMVGADLRIRRFTPGADDLFSLIGSDIGRPIGDLKPKLTDVHLERWISHVLQESASSDYDTTDRNGRWYRIRLRPYRTHDNSIDGVVVSVIDIDGIKKSEQQTRQSRDYAEAILGTIHIPLVVIDTQHRPMAANAAFFEYFHLARADNERRFERNFTDSHREVPELTKLLSIVMEDKADVRDRLVHCELPVVGNPVVLLNARRLKISSETPELLLVAIEDVTENERAALILREANTKESQRMESIGRLAGGIAHDFNNLLTVIIGYGESLSFRLAHDPESLEMLQAIRDASNRAASLTHQLLAYSRRQVMQPRVFDLNRALAEMEPMISRLLGESILIHLRPSPEPAFVMIDPSQMEQVIMNLCVNARDAMPQGGTLTLTTDHVEIDSSMIDSEMELTPGRYVALTVTDTGTGIESHILPKIFEPFYTTKDVGKGTGLGLSTLYGIVKQSGGHVQVCSEIGQGSVFRIYLPAFHLTAISQPNASTEDSTPALKTILLVEDEPEILQLQKLALASLHYRILGAKNGPEALSICHDHQGSLDVLVSDMVMPGMNGDKLAEAIRERYPSIKILFVSANVEYLPPSLLGSSDSTAFLQKPISISTFRTAVQKLISS